MPGGTFDLFQRKIAETYQRVVQYDSSSGMLLDGRGDVISITITGSIQSASHAEYAEVAEVVLQDFAITGSNIFQGNQVINGNTRITGSLTVTGSFIRNTKTITNNYTCNTNDKIILANTHTAFSASLISPLDGESIIFKVIGNFPLTVTPQPGATIDGNSNLIINIKWTSVELIASASNWYII